jgi:hypothetical protein
LLVQAARNTWGDQYGRGTPQEKVSLYHEKKIIIMTSFV